MRARMLAFIGGLLLVGGLPVLPSPDWLLLWPVCLLLLWCRLRWAVPAAMLAGGLYALAHASAILSPDFPATLSGESITITGKVINLPSVSEAVTRFNFRIQSVDVKDKKIPDQQALADLGNVRLSWYYAPADIRQGERWQLRVRLKPPHGFMNPGGFDYESWLFQQRLRATGYVREHADNRLLQTAPVDIQSLRAHLREQLASLLPTRQAAWLTALTIGDRSGLDADDWHILRSTGTSHLMAISGLHVGLVAALLFFPFRALWSVIPRATNYVSAQRLALLLALLGAASYAALAGFALPTQRALAMLAVFGLCVFWRRNVSLGDVLLWALLIVLLLDPFAGLNAGFWLSFIAVAVIGWGMNGRRLQPGLWWRYGRVQYVVALGLAPLLLFWFQEYPLLGVFANILAVPWVSLLVVPALLAGVVMALAGFSLAELAFHFAATALGYLWIWLEWLAQSGFALLARPAPAPVLVFAGLMGALLLLLPRAVPGRWLGILWLLPLLWPLSTRPPPGSFNFTLLDVGQGLAAVVETREYVLVYDTGAQFSENFDAGTAV
ncbi:MAG: DNA internalization-related competence protein ComEC/Rec2, partial [Gammaproteobacteria bacterium]